MDCVESVVEKFKSNFCRHFGVSVCMATYNGERYLQEQVESILLQLESTDELIVVDDSSDDGTINLLRAIGDQRIIIHRNNSNLGHVQTFSKAISLASNPIILMADQDDIWVTGRVAKMLKALEEKGVDLVSSNSDFIDSEGRPIPPLHVGLSEADSRCYGANIMRIFMGKAFYDGCAMGFRSSLRDLILPIPNYVESHDLWIAMASNIAKSNIHLVCITLKRRIHDQNASVKNRLFKAKIRSRAVFLISLFHLSFRCLSINYRISKNEK